MFALVELLFVALPLVAVPPFVFPELLALPDVAVCDELFVTFTFVLFVHVDCGGGGVIAATVNVLGANATVLLCINAYTGYANSALAPTNATATTAATYLTGCKEDAFFTRGRYANSR
jgi:hypothetical protein